MNSHRKVNSASGNHSQYFQPNIAGIPERIRLYVLRRMYKSLIEFTNPSAETTVLDVGVTSDTRHDCNFFEKSYPYPHMITAVGTEEASFLEKDYPGLKFLKVSGAHLPFKAKSFDIVVCFATVEHVGSKIEQRYFIHELCRVGRTCCITTPNRWYPIEFHTMLPLVHWLHPNWFRAILRSIGKDFLAKEENLNLLSEKDLLSMFPKYVKVYSRHFRLLGLVSNLMFFVEN